MPCNIGPKRYAAKVVRAKTVLSMRQLDLPECILRHWRVQLLIEWIWRLRLLVIIVTGCNTYLLALLIPKHWLSTISYLDRMWGENTHDHKEVSGTELCTVYGQSVQQCMILKLLGQFAHLPCISLQIVADACILWLSNCQDCTTSLVTKEALYALPQVHLIYHQVSCLVLRRDMPFLLWPSIVNEHFRKHKCDQTCGVSHSRCALHKSYACCCLMQQNRHARNLVLLACTKLKTTSPSADWYTIALNICMSISNALCLAICGLLAYYATLTSSTLYRSMHTSSASNSDKRFYSQ